MSARFPKKESVDENKVMVHKYTLQSGYEHFLELCQERKYQVSMERPDLQSNDITFHVTATTKQFVLLRIRNRSYFSIKITTAEDLF